MTKLIGSAPNQAPSNADLGSAAFSDVKDFLLSRGSSLSAINATVERGNFNDVFVYDTSKDSDGGAWRKRIQHTSWYNEPLNTDTRGSRREFPSVAVIGVRTNGIYIHDADDPTLPMWMVFIGADGGKHWSGTTNSPYRCHMLNGELMMGYLSSGGCRKINFIDETIYVLYDVSGTGHTQLGIAARNGALNWAGDPYYVIADRGIEDIIGVVPEGSPIKQSTGLPGVQWVISTDDGTSVITPKILDSAENDIAHIFDITGKLGGTETEDTWCNVDPSGVIWLGDRGQGQTNGAFYPLGFNGVEDNMDTSRYDYAYKTTASGLGTMPGPYVLGRTRQMRGNAFVGEMGVTLAKHNYDSMGKSMLAYITNEYNTGWLPGETVLSLSDTKSGILDGNNLVPNGSFTTSKYWTLGTGYSIDTDNGLLVDSQNISSTATSEYFYIQTTGTHTLSFYVTGDLGEPTVYIESPSAGNLVTLKTPSQPYDGIVSTTVELTAGEKVRIWVSGTAFIGNYKWINLRKDAGEEKTSEVFNRAIQKESSKQLMVQGTVYKTEVAQGTDLVAYHGFEDNFSHLEQPYDSALNIGDGNFTIAFWSKPETGAYKGIITRGDYNTGANTSWGVRVGPTSTTYQFWFGGRVRLQCPGGSSSQWNHVVITRQGGVLRGYVNGSLVVRTAFSNSIDAGLDTPSLVIGGGVNSSSTLSAGYYPGMLALIRITKTPIDQFRVTEMYEEEKKLFMTGAQSTLYGTSRDVTAVAYDDVTKEYHFGTSSGRSVFQDLARVDHTTDAVVTTISASNGFVAED